MNPDNTLLPAPEELKAIFDYNPETGVIRNKVNRGQSFRGKAGDISGNVGPNGYICIHLAGMPRGAHRIAWAIHYGEWPVLFIDHINGIKSDNRAINLRLATKSQNGWNSKRPSDNTSGIKGVSWSKACQKWGARIGNRHLGVFKTKEEAGEAYANAARRAAGEFARLA